MKVIVFRIFQQFQLILKMNKKGQLNLSTSRILKSKYNEKEKQKTIPLINRPNQKAKLLDLCPQQKLKIGQLIKTMQLRKQQNQHLSNQIEQLTLRYKQIEQMLRENVILLQEKDKRQFELMQEIERYKEKLRLKQQLMAYLEKDGNRSKQAVQSKPSNKQSSVQTERVEMAQVSTQTKKKKPKCRNYEVQVNLSDVSHSVFYKAHSKSFQKIMKGSLPAEIMAYKDRSRIITTQRFTQHKYQSSSLQKQSSPSVHDFQSESSDSAQILAEKWKELKEKHQNVNPMCSSFGVKQVSRKRFIDQGNQTHRDERAIPKKMSKFEQYDELQLNKLLKSKKFSAHKLIRLRDQSSHKNSKGKMSPEVNYLKSPCFNQQTSSNKMNEESPSDRDINFFQSDILQIAESLPS